MVSKRYVVTNSSFYVENINTLNALLEPAAEAGDPFAQNNLGYMFEHGKGVSMDHHKAVEWYQKGMLSQIHHFTLKISTRSTRFLSQLRKQGLQRLKTTLEICFSMEKEFLWIITRRLNGIKKVCCHKFIILR